MNWKNLLPERRGQAAVEYLVILAVVLIIALVVVGILGGFPQLTAGIDSRQSQSYWQEADIGIVPITIPHSTTGQLTVRNNKNFKVTIRSIAGITNSSGFGGLLSSGQTKTVSATYSGCTQGSTFSSTISFTYADTNGNVYNFTGALPYVDTCQG